MKTRTKCRQEKPFDCFSKHANSVGGLRSMCRSCAIEALHKYREATRNGETARVPRWTPEQDAILIARWPHETLNTISEEVNRTIEGVKSRAKKLGLLPQSAYHAPVCVKEEPKNHPLTRLQERQIREMRAKPVARDPFIAVLFGACEAIKATALPSRIFRQSMEVNDELEAA